MLLTIDVKERNIDKILYLLENLKDDITIVDRDDLNLEIIDEDDPDYKYIMEARDARDKGEKTYSLDEVLKELE